MSGLHIALCVVYLLMALVMLVLFLVGPYRQPTLLKALALLMFVAIGLAMAAWDGKP